MRKNKIIMIGIFLLATLLIAFGIMKKQALIPKQVGVLVAADSNSETTKLSANANEADEQTVVGTPTDTEAKKNIDAKAGAEVGDWTGEVSAAGIQEESQMFYYDEITQEMKDRITGKSYAANCEVPYEELRYASVLYWGFDEETHTGELIVNKGVAEDIVEIFKELYEAQYPIERMELIDEYNADDNASMEADNTSAFNYRTIDDGSGRLSNHSYGLAIDINPLYNPYVRIIDGETVVSPESGTEYSDRTLDCEYYIKEGDACYRAFTEHGFTWGGEWKNQKDYQHFQKKLS